MVSLLPILLLALSVKQDHTALRAGCDSDAEVVATLNAGARLTIRYALSGESTPCYKVAAETGGKTVEGYLSAGAMEGLDDFEQGRRDAAWLDTPQIIKSIRSSASLPSMSASPTGASPKSTFETAQRVADQAGQLIERSQPVEALALLEKFHDLLTTDSPVAKDLGKLVVFCGVRDYPARVKCATLAWHTLKSALTDESADPVVSTE